MQQKPHFMRRIVSFPASHDEELLTVNSVKAVKDLVITIMLDFI